MKGEKMCTVWMSIELLGFLARLGKFVVVVYACLENEAIEASVVEQRHPYAVRLGLLAQTVQMQVDGCPIALPSWSWSDTFVMKNRHY